MLKHIYKGGIAIALLTVAACSADTFTEGLTPGDTSIVLNGTVTRATGADEKGELKPLTGYKGLKLSAKYESAFYFKNQTMAVSDLDKNNQNKLTTSVRYPAGNKTIYLFAHTGDIADDGNLKLISGTTAENDILLSNGIGKRDIEGEGSKGSSDDNASLLTFRHAMTKIEVVANYTFDDQLQKPLPSKISIKFGTKLAAQGTIAMTSKLSTTTTKATAIAGDTGYALQLGDNYVVPTGNQLKGNNIISELTIDDYKATKEDCDALTIGDLDISGNDFILAPGLSYKLTLNIKRLKVVSITLKKKEWDLQSVDGEWGYAPYKIQMNFNGGYTNSNTDADARISKIVLKHTAANGKYQYVGGVDKDGNIDFVTLPASVSSATSDLTVDLYTKNGLLVEGIAPSDYSEPQNGNPGSLAISLGANGMNKDTDGKYEVTTPLQFYNMMKNPGKESYKLTKNNVDMNSLPLAYTPKEWPEGAELDGNNLSILHLDLKGSGLVTENNGTLKNIHIGPGTITSTEEYTGGLCSINNGTIEACINEADIVSPDGKTVGGICGKNTTKGTILACLNTGNIEKGGTIGGICGENANTSDTDVMKGCINAGMLNKEAANLGGICGTSATSNKTIVSTCYWLTGTARPVQQLNSEVAIGSDRSEEQKSVVNSADLAPEKLRDETVKKINNAISNTSWKFVYQKDANGTYPCVWPIPSRNN